MTWNLGQYSRTSSAPIGITQGETETETAILLQIFLRRLQVAIVPSSNMSAEPNTCLCLDQQRIYPQPILHDIACMHETQLCTSIQVRDSITRRGGREGPAIPSFLSPFRPACSPTFSISLRPLSLCCCAIRDGMALVVPRCVLCVSAYSHSPCPSDAHPGQPL